MDTCLVGGENFYGQSFLSFLPETKQLFLNILCEPHFRQESIVFIRFGKRTGSFGQNLLKVWNLTR